MSDAPKDAKSIFLAAVEIGDAAERAAFVERSCGDDAVLRKRVDDLLRAYGQPDGPLDKLAAALASTEISEPIREQVGATIGPYKLMEQIGEGGFGLVFVAEQQQPIRRKVALKIIKPGMDTRDVIARFEAERQALALMDHPNIARVLDAGTTESGRPYFVMELVRGIPITDHCDQNQLTPRERLTLFVDVCNAVQHAHTKGIIHRDVKPSNVLVTLHDDRPVVKVIDFGVAKALHQPLTEKTIYTRFAQMIGTPLYMSPEQAQMSGLDIDTRSDIYSLGVLLYELLTGTTPLDKQRLAKAAYDEMLKIIREEEPPKPSVRLSQSTDTLPSIAALRKTEPSKLPKMFIGDVDWIAMKALEKDRTRRYETANAFAADVLRYLNDEPVEASPPSTVYRVRKFARRHRTPVLVIALIAALLVIGIAGTTVGLVRARHAEQAALAAEIEARAAEHEARQQREEAETERNRAIEAEVREGNQRKTAERERDRAELQMGTGLLRPIGFGAVGRLTRRGGGALVPKNPSELRSLFDWSKFPDSRLKLRVLEIAFDDPETAMRVARRAEEVIQSCVGLSPKRRARAIEAVSARQRDLSADPRIRAAACWLALALDSTDLPAWPESCSYLADKQPHLFAEFVRFAMNHDEPLPTVSLNHEPLLLLLEKSNDQNILEILGDLLFTKTSRLDNKRLATAVEHVLAVLARQPELAHAAEQWLIDLGARVESKQATHALELLTSLRANGKMAYYLASGDSLQSIAAQVDSAHIARIADSLIARLDKVARGSPDSSGHVPETLQDVTSALKPLAGRLSKAQAEHLAVCLCAIAPKAQAIVLSELSDESAKVLSELDDGQAQRIADSLIAGLPAQGAIASLPAVTPRIGPAQAARAWDIVIKLATNVHPPSIFDAPDFPADALVALAPRLESRQMEKEGDRLVAVLENPTDTLALGRALAGLIALAPRLNTLQVKRAADALAVKIRQAVPNDDLAAARIWAIQTLATRVEPDEAKCLWDAAASSPDLLASVVLELAPRLGSGAAEAAADRLIGYLEHRPSYTGFYNFAVGVVMLEPRLKLVQIRRTVHALVAVRSIDALLRNEFTKLVGRLDPAEISDLADELITSIEKQAEPEQLSSAVATLIDLAPRLNFAQTERAWEFLIAAFPGLPENYYDALAALAPRLEPVVRDRNATRITAALLDDSCSGVTGEPNPGLFAPDISSAQSLAKLLSHPGCIGETRQRLLERFEEIVLYGGRQVWKPKPRIGGVLGGMGIDTGIGDKTTQPDPPHQFQNLRDAAAWIVQAWPGFDLETNCPVTWRGSR